MLAPPLSAKPHVASTTRVNRGAPKAQRERPPIGVRIASWNTSRPLPLTTIHPSPNQKNKKQNPKIPKDSCFREHAPCTSVCQCSWLNSSGRSSPSRSRQLLGRRFCIPVELFGDYGREDGQQHRPRRRPGPFLAERRGVGARLRPRLSVRCPAAAVIYCKLCPLAARICCTFSPTSFSSVQFSSVQFSSVQFSSVQHCALFILDLLHI